VALLVSRRLPGTITPAAPPVPQRVPAPAPDEAPP